MRIALVIPGGVGDETSGMHIPAMRDFVERLSKQHDVRVYSLAPQRWSDPDGSCGNAHVRYFPIHHESGTTKKLWHLFNACRKDHQLQKFDLVHALWAIPCGVTAVLLGKHLSIPAVVSFLGGETACLPQIRYGNMSHRFTRLTTLWVARHADALVTLTQHQTNELEKFGYEPRNRNIIPFGADKNLFTPTAKDISTSPIRFLHVANLHAVKDQPTLLRTFQSIAESVDARLRIIGEDQSGGSLCRLACELGILDKVEFHGYVPHRKLPLHYHWAHVLLHTSLHEAQGVVIAEAAASGVLVAGTRTGLLADFGDEMAVLSEPADYETLAAGILNVVAIPQKYDAMRYTALNWAREHDAEWTGREHVNLYEGLLEKGRN